ncbi:MAG: hypothetical protein KGI51_00020 [Rhodospirillales bacterium]|nr:hypothetical protein [Rhodospirillales bacterium]
MDSWDSVVRAAQKILGDKGKIPKIPPAIDKAREASQKTWDEFSKHREELKKKLLAVRDADEAWKDAVEQYQDEIDESDFGLDPKDKDDAKKITAAQKLLSGRLQQTVDETKENLKNERELDRHLMGMASYKQGA